MREFIRKVGAFAYDYGKYLLLAASIYCGLIGAGDRFANGVKGIVINKGSLITQSTFQSSATAPAYGFSINQGGGTVRPKVVKNK